jgi:hypothetical protein
LARPTLAQIPGDLARPFVRLYCERFDLPVEWEGFERVTWFGSFYEGALRAVIGFYPLSEVNGMLVYGLYGDGSAHEKRSLAQLFQFMDKFPMDLYGTVYAGNEIMQRALNNRRYTVHKTFEKDLLFYGAAANG